MTDFLAQLPALALPIALVLVIGYLVNRRTRTLLRDFDAQIKHVGYALQLRTEAETEIVTHILRVVEDMISTQPQLAEPLEITRLELQRQIAKLQADDELHGVMANGGGLLATFNAGRASARFRRDHGDHLTEFDLPPSVAEIARNVARDLVRDLDDADIRRIREGGDLP